MNSYTHTQPHSRRFIQPLSECKFTLETILEELQRDPQPVRSDKRPLRATGVAIAVAAGLLEVGALSVFVFVCLSVVYLSVVYLFVCLFVCLSIYLSMKLAIYLAIYLIPFPLLLDSLT